MDFLDIDKEHNATTSQLCEECGKNVKMGFGFALLNLDKKTLCEDCVEYRQ